jgi:hypothetical protein
VHCFINIQNRYLRMGRVDYASGYSSILLNQAKRAGKIEFRLKVKDFHL